MKKKGGLRLKLCGVIIPVVLVIIVVFFVLSRNMVLKLSQEKMHAQSQGYAGEISAWTDSIFMELNAYQDAIESGVFANDEEILAYMRTTEGRNENCPYGLYMGDDSGIYLDGSGWVPGDDWVLVERDWYVDGKDNDSFAFGEPYYDSMTGDMCVSASVRVDYPEAVRVLASDVYINHVVEVVGEIASKGEIGAFLVTEGSKMIIGHPDATYLAQTLDGEGFDSLYGNISVAISEGREGIIALDGDAGRYYVTLNRVENTEWVLVTYITEREMLSDLHWMECYILIVTVVATIIILIGVISITGKVVKPVERVTGVIAQIAEGDFSQDLEVSGNDEIAVMTRNMQGFICKMRETITDINNTAEWLGKQSVENEQVSESLMESSRNQISVMDELKRNAGSLSLAADDVVEQMNYLADLIRQTHEDGNAARSLMQESVDMTESGRSNMEQISAGMSGIHGSINTLSAQIAKVDSAMEQIGEMVNIIMNIAEETSLLSLNASIEAARAGESGRGFAVVAEQIGRLATNSSMAADDIAKLTEEIRMTVEVAISDMASSVSEVEKNVGTVEDAQRAFAGLYGKVEETSRQVEEMISLIGRVDEVAEKLDSITEKQHITANNIVESAIAMNSSTEGMTASSNFVAQSAEELKRESEELIEKISKFKV
ncbi:MAG: methyl-accepting chemotaxis protein [Lachnospiraceae bacterium]|nr:methyl-accepting chemotaxis protein [Lachnospiraceae bacterium]